MNTDDSVLLKIHRQFKKDESVKYLTDEIAKLNLTIGIHKSEISELEYKLDASIKGKLKFEWNFDTYVGGLKGKIIELIKKSTTVEKKNKELRNNINLWQSKYFDLLAKTTKNDTDIL